MAAGLGASPSFPAPLLLPPLVLPRRSPVDLPFLSRPPSLGPHPTRGSVPHGPDAPPRLRRRPGPGTVLAGTRLLSASPPEGPRVPAGPRSSWNSTPTRAQASQPQAHATAQTRRPGPQPGPAHPRPPDPASGVPRRPSSPSSAPGPGRCTGGGPHRRRWRRRRYIRRVGPRRASAQWPSRGRRTWERLGAPAALTGLEPRRPGSIRPRRLSGGSRAPSLRGFRRLSWGLGHPLWD